MTREAREKLVLDLLQDKWDNSNTYSLTPNITYGYFDQKEDGAPAVTVRQPNEYPLGGGDTTYDGIDPQGGSPHQTIEAAITCDIWTHSDDVVETSATTNQPRQYNERAAQEITRIIQNNAVRPSNPKTGNQPVHLMAPGNSRPVREEEHRSVYHYIQVVEMQYSRD